MPNITLAREGTQYTDPDGQFSIGWPFGGEREVVALQGLPRSVQRRIVEGFLEETDDEANVEPQGLGIAAEVYTGEQALEKMREPVPEEGVKFKVERTTGTAPAGTGGVQGNALRVADVPQGVNVVTINESQNQQDAEKLHEQGMGSTGYGSAQEGSQIEGLGVQATTGAEAKPPEQAEQQPAEQEDDLESKTVDELKDQLREQGKPVSGTKEELIARLQEDG